MAQFEAQIILDVKLGAPNEAQARQYIQTLMAALAHSLPQTAVPDIRLKLIKPDDGRLIAHVPNAPRQTVIAMLSKLPERQIFLVGMCAKPQTVHHLHMAVGKHANFRTATTAEIAHDISTLKLLGWLAPLHNHVELDVFPNTDTRAQFTALAGR